MFEQHDSAASSVLITSRQSCAIPLQRFRPIPGQRISKVLVAPQCREVRQSRKFFFVAHSNSRNPFLSLFSFAGRNSRLVAANVSDLPMVTNVFWPWMCIESGCCQSQMLRFSIVVVGSCACAYVSSMLRCEMQNKNRILQRVAPRADVGAERLGGGRV